MNVQPAVNQWRQQGPLHLFRAKRWQGQAWHMIEPPTGWTNLLELLRLLQTANEPCARTLQLIPHAAKGSEYHYSQKWRIEVIKEKDQADFWQWSGDTNYPVLQVGTNMLTEFITCLENERCEDYGIGLKDKKYASDASKAELWFWRTMMP